VSEQFEHVAVQLQSNVPETSAAQVIRLPDAYFQQ